MKRRTRITAGIIMLIVASVAVALGIWRWEMRQELNRAWADWVAAGGPTSLRDVKPAGVPDERNAALAYRPALAMIEALSDEERQLLRMAESVDDDIVALIERLQDALMIAIEARTFEECLWDATLYDKDGEDIVFHWFQPASALVRALIFDARIKAERELIDEAMLSLEAALVLSGHLGTDPFLILHIARANHDVAVMDAIEEIFRSREFPASSQVGEILRARDYRRGVTRMVMADALWALRQFDRRSELKEYLSEPYRQRETPPGYRWLHFWFIDLDKAAYLNSVRATAEALGQAAPTRIGRVIDPHELPPYARISWIFMPGLGGMDGLLGRAEVRRVLALTALALREHRAGSGEYPETRTMPADPMTGNPMSYERDEEGGFLLESDYAHRRTEHLQWRWR